MKRRSSKTLVLLLLMAAGCQPGKKPMPVADKKVLPQKFLVVLGIVQDAGYPQIGCEKECCAAYWQHAETKKYITCLAVVDNTTNQFWLLEATPDIAQQLKNVQTYLTGPAHYSPDGIFITHAHIGHYSGLMQLGREAMGAKSVPVWAMPRMDSFLRNNGPWSQLVSLQNIRVQPLKEDSTVSINTSLKITPVKVPHRDEFSETAGFIIKSSKKKILFIPDIDKWGKWNRKIIEEINKADIALLDGTFYKNGELPGRDMKEIPHPFVEESMALFSSLPAETRSKIVFIHFNHTNPLLKKESAEKETVKSSGFGVAEEGMVIEL
jgi:pyrroloquinoline quinone biosynthesis protein B